MTGCIALLMVSCSNDQKIKAFAEEFSTAVTNGDRAAIKRMYPDAVKADSLAILFNADSLVIEKDEEQKQITLTLGNGADLLVSENADGEYVIQSSHGTFAYPAHELSFAKKTGQWKDGLTDAEQAERMADKGLADYLFEEFNNKVKSALSIAETDTWGDDYYEGEWVSSKGVVFKVKNSSSIDIPGSAWNIIYKEGYWGGGEMASEEVPGNISFKIITINPTITTLRCTIINTRRRTWNIACIALSIKIHFKTWESRISCRKNSTC